MRADALERRLGLNKQKEQQDLPMDYQQTTVRGQGKGKRKAEEIAVEHASETESEDGYPSIIPGNADEEIDELADDSEADELTEEDDTLQDLPEDEKNFLRNGIDGECHDS
jgi:hypothetical protein